MELLKLKSSVLCFIFSPAHFFKSLARSVGLVLGSPSLLEQLVLGELQLLGSLIQVSGITARGFT